MAHSSHAIKDIRKAKRRLERNKYVKSTVEALINKSRKAITAKAGEAEKLVKETIKKLDKAAQKGILKKNTVSRKKSRLMKKLNALKKA